MECARRAVGTLSDVLGPELLCAHCVRVEDHEISQLAAADVPAQLDPGEGLPHIWQLLPGLPESSAGLDRAAEWALAQVARR